MADQPTIQFTFANEYPGRFPGESGVYSKTILEFTDVEGEMASVARKLIELQAIQMESLTRILAGKTRIHRIKIACIEMWRGHRFERLQHKTRQLMLRLLRTAPLNATLRVASETASNGFRPIEHEYQAQEIADKLERSSYHWLALC